MLAAGGIALAPCAFSAPGSGHGVELFTFGDSVDCGRYRTASTPANCWCAIDMRSSPSSRAGPPQYDSSGRAPAAAIRACNKFADQGYDGTIISQNAMKPGWWEVVLRFEQYRYACNVSSRGQVESFNKTN